MSRSRRSQWQAMINSQIAASKSSAKPLTVSPVKTDRRAMWLASMTTVTEENAAKDGTVEISKSDSGDQPVDENTSQLLSASATKVERMSDPGTVEISKSDSGDQPVVNTNTSQRPSVSATKAELVNYLISKGAAEDSRTALMRKTKAEILTMIS